jgi:type IV pilus assembly protein PilM
MNWETLKTRWLPHKQPRTGAFLMPSLALDIQPDFVAAALLDASKRQVRRVAVRQLESGALDPLSNRPNLAKQEVVRRAIQQVLEAVGTASGKLGVLLPDSSARVAILHFEALPRHREEADALVRWKMGEILSFPPEEARVSYQLISKRAGSVELLAMAMRSSVVAEYETLLEALSDVPVLILPATAALLPLLPTAGNQGGKVLVHVCSGSITSVLTVGQNLSFWRNRLLEGPEADAGGEVVREIARVLATCRDHLKREIEDLWVYVRPPASRSLLEKEIREATGKAVQFLASSASHGAVLPPAEKNVLEGFGMTFAGLLENQS